MEIIDGPQGPFYKREICIKANNILERSATGGEEDKLADAAGGFAVYGYCGYLCINSCDISWDAGHRLPVVLGATIIWHDNR